MHRCKRAPYFRGIVEIIETLKPLNPKTPRPGVQALRSLETGLDGWSLPKNWKRMTEQEVVYNLRVPNPERMLAIKQVRAGPAQLLCPCRQPPHGAIPQQGRQLSMRNLYWTVYGAEWCVFKAGGCVQHAPVACTQAHRVLFR